MDGMDRSMLDIGLNQTRSDGRERGGGRSTGRDHVRRGNCLQDDA